MGKKNQAFFALTLLFGLLAIFSTNSTIQRGKQIKKHETTIDSLHRQIVVKDSTIIWQHRKSKFQEETVKNLNNHIARQHGRGKASLIK